MGTGRLFAISTGQSQLPDDRIEGGGRPLRTSDGILAFGRIPEEFQRPAIRTMVQQAPQREADLDRIHKAITGSGHRVPENADRKIDDHLMVTRKGGHWLSGSRGSAA